MVLWEINVMQLLSDLLSVQYGTSRNKNMVCCLYMIAFRLFMLIHDEKNVIDLDLGL